MKSDGRRRRVGLRGSAEHGELGFAQRRGQAVERSAHSAQGAAQELAAHGGAPGFAGQGDLGPAGGQAQGFLEHLDHHDLLAGVDHLPPPAAAVRADVDRLAQRRPRHPGQVEQRAGGGVGAEVGAGEAALPAIRHPRSRWSSGPRRRRWSFGLRRPVPPALRGGRSAPRSAPGARRPNPDLPAAARERTAAPACAWKSSARAARA